MPLAIGPVRFGPSGLEPAGKGNGALLLIDTVLRGVGQVVFLNNGYSGLLCLLGIALNAPLQAAAAFAGSLAGTLAAMWLRADPAAVRAGLYGYNGCLVGIAVPLFLDPSPLVWALAMLAAALSSPLLMALRPGRTLGLPPLTAPFVLATWAVIGCMALMAQAGITGPREGATRSVSVPQTGLFGDWTVVDSALGGIAQVFLQPSPLSGALIALALLAGSRPVFLLACLAGLASALSAGVIGVPAEAIRAGLFGFNAVLAAIALGAVFLPRGGLSVGIALIAALVLPAFQMLCALVLSPLGLPTMSLPFLLATWAVLAATRAVTRLRPAP